MRTFRNLLPLLLFSLIVTTSLYCYAEEVNLTEEQKQELLKALEPKLQRIKSDLEKINQMQQKQGQQTVSDDKDINQTQQNHELQLVSPGKSKSLREMLIASEHIYEVFAIDDYYTYVRPNIVFFGKHSGEPSEDFAKEIVAACPTQIEIDRKQTDPITREIVVTWVPYDGKTYLFHRVEKDNIREGVFHDLYGVRCKGKFEIVTTYTEERRTSSFGSLYNVVKAFIIKHEDPQPFLFKSEYISPDKITWPTDGELKLVSMGIGGFFKAIVSKEVREDTVVYQYVTALCRNNNGKMKFVINEGEFIADPKGKIKNLLTGETGRYRDKLVETDSKGAFNYAVTASSVKRPVQKIIFYACEGPKQFVVRSEEKVRYDGGTAHSVLHSYFASQKGLEGIDYVSLSQPKRQATSYISGSQKPVTIEQQIALEVVNKKTTIFKVFSSQEYTGIYNGRDHNGCDLVSVQKNWDTTLPKPRIDTYNYKVCDGVIADVSETGIETLPKNIGAFITRIIKVAQRTGTAEGDYEGYNVKAVALRDKDNCMVEVKVFRDINLITSQLLNACQ